MHYVKIHLLGYSICSIVNVQIHKSINIGIDIF